MGVSQILGLSLSLILRSSATSVPLHVVERDAAHSQSAEPGEAAIVGRTYTQGDRLTLRANINRQWLLFQRSHAAPPLSDFALKRKICP